MHWLSIGLGGILGTVFRYATSKASYAFFGISFPYGTLIVNLLGCLAIGFLNTFFEDKNILNPNLRMFLFMGFCGAFTTFSTFILETLNLLKEGLYLLSFLNIFISVIAGIILFLFGHLLAKLC